MTTPIHIIQCADYGGPYAGSFVPMLVAAAREAVDRGHRTTIVLSDVARGRPWLREFDGLAEVRLIPAEGSRSAGIGPAIRHFQSVLSTLPGPAVIHTHFTAFDIPAALMRLQRRDLAVFWHEHTVLRDDPRTRLRNTLRYACLAPLVAGILCVSPELRRELEARHAPKRKLRDFPNAIDTTLFASIGEAERSAARRALALADRARVVLHFGWSWQLKGGDLMLAAAELLASDPDLVLLTVLAESAPQFAALYGNRIVRPLPPTDDVKSLYAASDVFLSASRGEGALPLAVLEALACGLAVVATDIPVQQGLLAGLPGAVTVAAEPAAIAAGIRAMLSLTEAERVRSAQLVQASFADSFSLGAWARRLIDLYEAALQR